MDRRATKGRTRAKARRPTATARAKAREMARIRKEKARASRKVKIMVRAKVNRRAMPKVMATKVRREKEMVDLSKPVIRVASPDISPVIAGE